MTIGKRPALTAVSRVVVPGQVDHPVCGRVGWAAEPVRACAINSGMVRLPEIHMAAMREPNCFAFPDGRNRTHPDAGRAITDFEKYASLFAGTPPGAVVGEV